MNSRTTHRLADKHLTDLREKVGQLEDLANLQSVLERQLVNLGAMPGADAERKARLSASIDQIQAQITQMEGEVAAASRTLKVMGVEPPVFA